MRFDEEKGFGFIAPDDGGKDLFAHFSEISMDGYKKLTPGERVSYLVEKSSKGLRAIGIVKI
jgi:CspA family cold shock protein